MEQLSVMTFNLRQMDGDDGAHAWEHRKSVLAETILLKHPALLGTQEGHKEQIDYILEQVPYLTSFGRGRFGDDRDKHCKVFYDPNILQLQECGEFWFSAQPEVPGSSAWDIPRPRMVTWGKMSMASGDQLFVMNTHLPYGRNADVARRESARLINEAIEKLPQKLAIIATGDFNTHSDGETYKLLTHNLHDAWTSADKTAGPKGTMNGFGRFTDSKRIDWILHRNVGHVLSAETVTHMANGLYPSDHYPVYATFELNK
jgi:endonuclease/exonuclease/phosphatase family metal-dependent hydrolase